MVDWLTAHYFTWDPIYVRFNPPIFVLSIQDSSWHCCLVPIWVAYTLRYIPMAALHRNEKLNEDGQTWMQIIEKQDL